MLNEIRKYIFLIIIFKSYVLVKNKNLKNNTKKSNSLYYKIKTTMFNSFEMIKIEGKNNKLHATSTFNNKKSQSTLKSNKYDFTI